MTELLLWIFFYIPLWIIAWHVQSFLINLYLGFGGLFVNGVTAIYILAITSVYNFLFGNKDK